jgi:hypothetical protein
MKTKTLCVALLAALAAGALAYAELGHGRRGEPSTGTPAPRESSGLRADGQVTGLYPGRHKPLWVQVRNPFDRRARVRWIRTWVKDAGPDCADRYVVPRKSRGLRQLRSGRWRHVLLPPHQTRRVRVRLRMTSGAPNACQGQAFPLRFRVKVKVWGQP